MCGTSSAPSRRIRGRFSNIPACAVNPMLVRLVSFGLNLKSWRNRIAIPSPISIMELKVQCDCGQKFKFDVEPVNNEVPHAINCPVCGADGTSKANALLKAQAAAPPVAAAPAQLRISATPPPIATAPPPPRMPAAVARPAIAGARAPAKDSSGPTNLGMGALG